MSGYYANLPEIQRLLQEAADLDKALADQLLAVERRIADLHIDWQGRTATAHREFMDRWNRDAAEMQAALRSLKAAVDRAHGNYTSVAAHQHWMWPE